MIKGSDLFVAALENEGVQRIFGVPGEENLDTVESLRTSNIELVVTRHEQSAAFMAATYGRLTGQPGVCISTLGPGALNLATGASYAHLGAMPMILITGQKAIKSSQQARFQIVSMVATMTPHTKFSRQIISTSSIPTIVREAFRVATEERPGPVHLELPEDIAGESGPDVPLVPPHPIELPVAHPVALDRAAQMIRQAARPLVMLGAAASRPRLGAYLADFLARTQRHSRAWQLMRRVKPDASCSPTRRTRSFTDTTTSPPPLDTRTRQSPLKLSVGVAPRRSAGRPVAVSITGPSTRMGAGRLDNLPTWLLQRGVPPPHALRCSATCCIWRPGGPMLRKWHSPTRSWCRCANSRGPATS